MSQQVNLKSRFFNAIGTFSGKALKPLLPIVKCDCNGASIQDRAFHNIIGREKNELKRMALNQRLCLCGLKWTASGGKKQGQVLQPGTLKGHINFKSLFFVFRRKGIQDDWEKDFNDRKELHGLVMTIWEKSRKQDPTFGCRPNQAPFMEDSDKRVPECLHSGATDINNPKHLLRLVMHVMGRCCGLRSGREHHQLVWGNVHFGRCGVDGLEAPEDIQGLKFGGAHTP